MITPTTIQQQMEHTGQTYEEAYDELISQAEYEYDRRRDQQMLDDFVTEQRKKSDENIHP